MGARQDMGGRTASPLVVGGRGVSPVRIGGDLVLIAGPCGLESAELALEAAERIDLVCRRMGVRWVFKSSFDKANRSAAHAWRGPGLDKGLRILADVRARIGVPVTTDVHLPGQADAVAEVVDMLQVPAFLCRQTDLLLACAQTGRPVNVKKGQFLSPPAAEGIVDKVGRNQLILTERGACFGHGDLVVDFRSLVLMRSLGVPVCFDATHSTQRPGAHSTGGDRSFAAPLARAAAAVGVDALFVEVHPEPSQARSDAATQIDVAHLESMLTQVLQIHRLRSAAIAPQGGSGQVVSTGRTG